ncbi:MAG: hypothetical protein JWM41_4251 [Gemmatimonadetes bacterium]|nr:hypothetical protein [Gemmatimonadota bacterium]
MLERPTFDSRYRVTLVDGDGVFVVSDSRQILLPGRAYARLAPLLDGRRTTDQVAACMEEEAVAGRAAAYFLMMELEERGLLRDGARDESRDCAGGYAAVQERVTSWLGDHRDDVRVIVVDDYLDPSLEVLNRDALFRGEPWLIAKASGEEAWVGPLLGEPGGPCWECLAHYLSVLRPVDAYLAMRRHDARVLARPAVVDSGVLAALDSSNPNMLCGAIVAVDTRSYAIERRVVPRRAQCEACGDPEWYARRLERIDVVPTVRRTPLSAAPMTSRMTKLSSVDDARFHVFVGAPAGLGAHDLASLQRGLDQRSAGSGTTDCLAVRAAVGESIERYCGAFQGDEPQIAASLHELGARGVHPNACMLFSDRQYAARAEWNSHREPTTYVPEPFDPSATIAWTPVWSLTRDEHRYLPTAFLYRNAGALPGGNACVADSNGCAAGETLADAVTRGFFELAERDAIALWWYRRAPKPRVDLSTLRDDYCRQLVDAYDGLERDCWVLDITSDLGVPAFAAVSRSRDDRRELLFGFGAHFDAERAVTHACTELNQIVASVAALRGKHECLSPAFARWLAGRDAHDVSFLSPFEQLSAIDVRMYPADSDGGESIDRCRRCVESRDMELLVLDQTRDANSLAVAKVIVPGLRPAHARFAPGRLSDVVNEIPFFL